MKGPTIKEAVKEALELSEKPLTAKEIFNYITANNLYQFNAERPENVLKGEIRRHCEGVDFPTASATKYFILLLDGTYWIKGVPVPGQTLESQKAEEIVRKDSDVLKSVVNDLKDIHAKHIIAFKKHMLNQLKEMPAKTFEVFAKRLLDVYGFKDMTVTSYSKDGGIDGYGKLKVGITHLHVAFQCKRWKTNSVGSKEINSFRGAIQGTYEQGIFFTTSYFSKPALEITRKSGAVPIILIDGSTLIDIMIEKRFGVAVENMPVYVNSLEDVFIED